MMNAVSASRSSHGQTMIDVARRHCLAVKPFIRAIPFTGRYVRIRVAQVSTFLTVELSQVQAFSS